MNHGIGFVLRGRFVHGVGAAGELEIIEDGCVAVGEDGAISHVAKTTEDVESLLRRTDQRVLTCADTYVPWPPYCTIRTGHAYGTSLLRAVRTGGTGQLTPGAPRTVPHCVPWHLR